MAPPKMAGCCSGSRKVAIRLRFVRRRLWPEEWSREANPGDLLMLGDVVRKCGALLRLPIPGLFITLTADQVWRRHPIPWPVAGEDVLRFTIRGQQAEVVYR